MYCPKCGVNNLEDAKFCRSCGADIRLVPQALAGRLPEGVYGMEEFAGLEKKGRKEKIRKPPTLEKGLENIFGGLAFLVIFLLGLFLYQGAFMIWVWFIIPGLSYVGEGIGQVIRSRSAAPALAPPDSTRPAPSLPQTHARELPAADTSEIKAPPASVTESTTRHLSAPRERTAEDA